MSLPSLSQTATKTAPQQDDSLICLPKTIVRYMVQDIVRGDGAKAEVAKLDSTLKKRDVLITKQDSTIRVQDKEIRSFKITIADQTEIDSINQKTIETLSFNCGRYKRQRNAFKAFCVILLVVFGAVK